MTKSLTSWDDIPSLELDMKDSSKKEDKPLENRNHIRIDSNILKGLLYKNTDFIPVKIATRKEVFDGKIEDLSQYGVKISMPGLIEKDEPVKIGFVINSRKIIVKGIVRWASKNNSGFKAGLEFIVPDQSDVDFIRSLTHASNFNKVDGF